MKISPRYFISLDKALKLLPGVKPRKASAMIKEAFHQLAWNSHVNGSSETADIGGSRLNLAEIEHLVIDDNAVTKVSPAGAALLINLYRAGSFPMERKSSLPAETPDLKAYADSESELQAKQAAADAEEARQKHLVDNPSEIAPSEFTYGLLNDVFFRHRGAGSHSMAIGGVEVLKSVVTRSSNSGKTRDSDVSFTWTDAEGQKREISKQSRFADNRSNDPDRNWGLGRE